MREPTKEEKRGSAFEAARAKEWASILKKGVFDPKRVSMAEARDNYSHDAC